VRDAFRLLTRTQSLLRIAAIGNVTCAVVAALIGSQLIMPGCFDATREFHLVILDGFVVLVLFAPLYWGVAHFVPKRYFRNHPSSPVLRLASPLLLAPGLLLPLTASLSAVTRRLFRGGRGSERGRRPAKITSEDLLQILTQSRTRTNIASVDKRMLYGMFGLEQTIVREIMQPLVNVAALSRDEATYDVIVQISRESGYSRIPVFSKRLVFIDGIIDVRGLLRTGPETRIEEAIAPPRYIPETMRADVLLRMMIRERIPLAVVVDEYGGTVGLVTQEDVLEEIVGEIEDEFDPAKPTVIAQADGSYLVDGRMDIDDLNDRFELSLPNADFDTLGGFIYDDLARIPRVGDTVERDLVRVEVMSMDGRQIERVKLQIKTT
jgi:CBS domain containing-hemolysin-like protein